jgi:hypothetical protein
MPHANTKVSKETIMPQYLRTGPVVTHAAGYIQTNRQPFEWVEDIKQSTKDPSLEAVQRTQQHLIDEHQIETEVEEIQTPGIPQAGSWWAIKKKE